MTSLRGRKKHTTPASSRRNPRIRSLTAAHMHFVQGKRASSALCRMPTPQSNLATTSTPTPLDTPPTHIAQRPTPHPPDYVHVRPHYLQVDTRTRRRVSCLCLNAWGPWHRPPPSILIHFLHLDIFQFHFHLDLRFRSHPRPRRRRPTHVLRYRGLKHASDGALALVCW